MLVPAHVLLRLAVETQSGMKLGRVSGFEFETEGQVILRYEVRRLLFAAPLLIHRDQVVMIDATRMVVQDAAVPVELRSRLETPKSLPEESAATQSRGE
ncbi:hypothetical protein HY478_03905 [Candidatus Uhrbacteria bacterium]|nr:hypothetical protein [Candidatus Uhrbacteria bacterium]